MARATIIAASAGIGSQSHLNGTTLMMAAGLKAESIRQ